jgi:hypothetical protein
MPAEKKEPARTVSLGDLQPVAARLNSVSDDLNAALKDIEAHLVSLNIGLEVFVDLRPERAHFLSDDDALNIGDVPGFSWVQEQLGLERRPSGEWKLIVKRRNFVELDKQRAEAPAQITLLLQASREDRLAAVAKIPELLAAIHTKASAAIERIERARELANNLIPF